MKAMNFGPVGNFSPSASLYSREVRGGGALPEFPGGGGACCSTRLDRRGFFQLAGSAGLLALSPSLSLAAEGDYEAMLLSCIDPRMVTPVYKYMDQRGLAGQYSQLVIAGAAIAVVAPKFEVWRPAFWDNLDGARRLDPNVRLIEPYFIPAGRNRGRRAAAGGCPGRGRAAPRRRHRRAK